MTVCRWCRMRPPDLGQPLTLGTAVGLLLGGIVQVRDTGLSAALFAAGFIVLGVWIAREIKEK
jgi:hypothetical protein